MNCEGLLERLGFNCRDVGREVVAVSTPFSFCDGEPIGFYLRAKSNSILLSDNADTLAHLAAIGFDISDRKKWKGIKQSISLFGFELLDSGEIVGESFDATAQSLFEKYVGAILTVADFERDYLGISEELDQYLKEVEFSLRVWKPDSEVSHFASAEGHSGRVHKFHFEQDNTLIDAARPHQNRTGSILRKSADVLNTGTAKKIMVVMDDRDDLERAKVETDILSTMVSVIAYSSLAGQGPVTNRFT
jgi:hypothetical protein